MTTTPQPHPTTPNPSFLQRNASFIRCAFLGAGIVGSFGLMALMSGTITLGQVVLGGVVVVLAVAALGFALEWLRDMSRHSEDVWANAGRSKSSWLMAWGVTALFGFNTVAGIYYWFAVRPKLRAARA